MLLALFCLFISHRQLRPLQRLVDEARSMAEGRLDVPVEESHRTDEVGYVQNTFLQMQQSIGQHIANITYLTGVLQQRNTDLKLAYEQAREADRMKDAVILNMSDRMEQSVKGIHATVGDFRQHVADMNADECRQMAEKIRRYTETTTDLLGQLQNSFCQMRRSISQHIRDAEQTKQETEQRTKELEQATLLARQASEQKT